MIEVNKNLKGYAVVFVKREHFLVKNLLVHSRLKKFRDSPAVGMLSTQLFLLVWTETMGSIDAEYRKSKALNFWLVKISGSGIKTLTTAGSNFT